MIPGLGAPAPAPRDCPGAPALVLSDAPLGAPAPAPRDGLGAPAPAPRDGSERLRLFPDMFLSESLRLLPEMVSERMRLLPEMVSERLRLFPVMFLFESFCFHKLHPFIRVSAVLDLSISHSRSYAALTIHEISLSGSTSPGWPITSHLRFPSSSLFVFSNIALSSEFPHHSNCWFRALWLFRGLRTGSGTAIQTFPRQTPLCPLFHASRSLSSSALFRFWDSAHTLGRSCCLQDHKQ